MGIFRFLFYHDGIIPGLQRGILTRRCPFLSRYFAFKFKDGDAPLEQPIHQWASQLYYPSVWWHVIRHGNQKNQYPKCAATRRTLLASNCPQWIRLRRGPTLA